MDLGRVRAHKGRAGASPRFPPIYTGMGVPDVLIHNTDARIGLQA